MPSAVAPLAASSDERDQIGRLNEELSEVRGEGSVRLVTADGREVELPSSALEALARVVHQMARGNAVSLVPVGEMLTTQQAADLLGVSRPHLVHLLEDGEIPFEKVGTHRRIRFEDLMAYKRVRDEQRRDALRRLTEEAERLGLDY